MEARAIRRAVREWVEIELPPSKSYTQRALIAASLADGESIIRNPSRSSDSLTMIEALRKFGIAIVDEGHSLTVRGGGGILRGGERTIDVGNAGTCMRFLSALAALAPGTTTLTGDGEMLKRPVLGLVRALRDAGADASCADRCPPVTVRGGNLAGGRVSLDASESSQFLSALLLVAPYSTGPLEIVVAGTLTSAPYIAMTLSVMRDFSVDCGHVGAVYRLEHPRRYAAREYTVEPDVSSATFFGAAAAITGCTVTIPGVRRDTLQGDIAFFTILREMGCAVVFRDRELVITGGILRGVRTDMNALPDSVPALAVTAAFASTPTTVTNVSHLRHKETDRLRALANELNRIGASATVAPAGIDILPGRLRGCEIETYNDHRIAMSFAVAGLKADGMRILNPGCVAKSFPGFWAQLEKFN
ncbi:MAG TPA: 3-phosphoshikimate 1-carboxyvinyltransferase [Bacteroidota bacterium]|nr:3-phosphoshikimate 1-carboxyvinyltransferase [Bacteroidota bacterium]